MCSASRSVRHLQSVKASSTVGGVLLEALRSQKEHMRMCTRTAQVLSVCEISLLAVLYEDEFMKSLGME